MVLLVLPLPSSLYALRCTIYPRSSFFSLLYPLLSKHLTCYSLHSMLYAVRFYLRMQRLTVFVAKLILEGMGIFECYYGLPYFNLQFCIEFSLYQLLSLIYALHSTIHPLRFSNCSLHSKLYDLHDCTLYP